MTDFISGTAESRAGTRAVTGQAAPVVVARPRSAVIRELGPGPAPEDVFRALARRRGAFFLDSAAGPEALSRWSFLGAEPFLVLEAFDAPESGERTVVETEAGRRSETSENPFTALRRTLERLRLPRAEGPLPFSAGAVGYLGYDLKHSVERLPRRALRDQSFPDMRFGFHDRLLAHDRESDSWYAAVAPVGPGLSRGTEEGFDELLRVLEAASSLGPFEPSAESRDSSALRPNMSRDEYLRSVERVIEYIAAGDIFQANFTQRFECRAEGEPWDLYVRLRDRNPAPFAAYLDAGGGRAILSSSPERFLALRGRQIETRPIKGTRPRGSTPEGDRANAVELLASEKDAAELAMIVDLERNDLGRVADYGSVRVAEARALETHPTVFHLVATVVGRLAEGRDGVDLLKAAFPGGSITGAPKIRAMEIIEELEPTARGVYTGAVGYLDLGGDLDLNIVIRTMLWTTERPCGDHGTGTPVGRVTYQVGGGIVADSDPAAEYEESLAKGRALAEVLSGGRRTEGNVP